MYSPWTTWEAHSLLILNLWWFNLSTLNSFVYSRLCFFVDCCPILTGSYRLTKRIFWTLCYQRFVFSIMFSSSYIYYFIWICTFIHIVKGLLLKTFKIKRALLYRKITFSFYIFNQSFNWRRLYQITSFTFSFISTSWSFCWFGALRFLNLSWQLLFIGGNVKYLIHIFKWTYAFLINIRRTRRITNDFNITLHIFVFINDSLFISILHLFWFINH